MPRYIEGNLIGTGKRFAIVVGRFNSFISESLLTGAVDVLTRHAVADEDITVVRVPGSFEIAAMADKLAKSEKYHGVVGVGCLIRGSTIHFDLIASEAAKGLARAGLDSGVPVTFGIITTDTIEQAIERAGTKVGNKGADAAMAALEMANLYEQLG